MSRISSFAAGWEVTSWTDATWREAHRWENKPPAQQAGETSEAWDQWIMASCAERNGGHQWWLDWDADDGLDLHCQYCPAGVDELYPDGGDLIFAELPLLAGKMLRIEHGEVPLGTDAPCQSWSGPVRAWVHAEIRRGGPWGLAEYDAWVIAEAVCWPSPPHVTG